MASNQKPLDSKTILTSPGGNIESKNTFTGTTLALTHPDGSNLQFGSNSTSQFNSTNYQSLTLQDSFSTTYGDNSCFVKGSSEFRVEGDLTFFSGSSDLLSNDLQQRWFQEYCTGYGGLKTQWRDNRKDLAPEDFPINTVYNKPSGANSLVVCPNLLDGTAEDNKNAQTKKAFEDKMKKTGEDKAKILQQDIDNSYSNLSSNITSLYNSINK